MTPKRKAELQALYVRLQAKINWYATHAKTENVNINRKAALYALMYRCKFAALRVQTRLERTS